MGSEYRRRYANMLLAADMIDVFKKGGLFLSGTIGEANDLPGVAHQLCVKLEVLSAEDRNEFVRQLKRAHDELHSLVAIKFAPTQFVVEPDGELEAAEVLWSAVTFEQASEYVLSEHTTDEMYASYMDALKANRPDLFQAVSDMLAEAASADKAAAAVTAAAAAKKAAEDKKTAEAEKKARAAAEKKATADKLANAAAEKKAREAKS